jgi:PHD/YefM family antitoxin component YafN of YafNO toxin-antitoxin module
LLKESKIAMAPYTVSVHQAEKQLRKLIARAQDTQQPIVMTAEETAEPVAVLVESAVFALLQKREQQLFHLRLQELQQQLDRVTETWPATAVRQQFVTEFQASAQTLWSVCPEAHQDLCVTLVMATRRLTPQALNMAQLSAFHTILDLLRDSAPSEAAITACHQQLIACGLPPMMGGSQELARLYEEAL